MLPVCLHPSSHSPICSFSHTIITLVVRVSHSWSMLENIFVIYSSLPTTSLFYFPFLGFPPSFIFVLSVFVPQSTRCWFTVLLYASWPAVEQLTYPLHQWWWSHLTTKSEDHRIAVSFCLSQTDHTQPNVCQIATHAIQSKAATPRLKLISSGVGKLNSRPTRYVHIKRQNT